MIGKETETQESPRPPITLWIVEDDTLFLQEVEATVERVEDMVCTHTFGDMAEVEGFLAKEKPVEEPQVILMDIRLPGKSGIEGTRDLRARFPEVTIIMLTWNEDDDSIFQALRAGASGYLLKGMGLEQILKIIREAGDGLMSMPEAVAKKMMGFFRDIPEKGDYQLTLREQEILALLCDGLTQRQIATSLFISQNTVNQHMKAIYVKLHVNNATAAVAKAIRERLLK